MLDDIRNAAGDLLSGKMKDAEIALTKQESTILRLKVEGLLDQLAALREERVTIIKEREAQRLQLADKNSLIADLTAKMNERDRVADVLENPTHEVLKLLFNVDEGLDRGSIRSHLDMTEGVVMYHLDTLKELDFIGHKRGRDAIMGVYSEGTSFIPRGAPEKFFIKPKGRAYIMKNG